MSWFSQRFLSFCLVILMALPVCACCSMVDDSELQNLVTSCCDTEHVPSNTDTGACPCIEKAPYHSVEVKHWAFEPTWNLFALIPNETATLLKPPCWRQWSTYSSQQLSVVRLAKLPIFSLHCAWLI